MTDTQPGEKPEGVNRGAAAIAPRCCTGQLVFLGLEVRGPSDGNIISE
jgi:hypothetical protein